MGYIILNGKNSNEIEGLIIQKMPPIIKPKIRTTIAEIDGVSGDIVTNLGYSAYDKELLIGLKSNHDIDKVIEYFNSSGTVVFSNEEDKIYTYTIIKQIDFNSLLRFRKAKIVFHVQPFKHLLNERTLIFDDFPEWENQFEITNIGNIIAKPKITIYGEDDINIKLNNKLILTINLGNEGNITIDAENMDAYKDTLDNLKNRLVKGNYDDLFLNQNANSISIEGVVEKVEISNYSRWI